MLTFALCNILQNLCVNEEVRRLGSIQRINDRCMELQKNKHGGSRWQNTPPVNHLPDPTECHCCLSSSGKGSFVSLLISFADRKLEEEGAKRKRGPAKSVCPFYKASALQRMRDGILGKVQDIEQLLQLGREMRACPYYSTRLAIPPAQVTPRTSVRSHRSPPPANDGDVFSRYLYCLVCFPQLVVLPYQVLLHEATRKAAGVQLKGQARSSSSASSSSS